MKTLVNVISRLVKAVVTFGIISAITFSLFLMYAFILDGDTPLYFRIGIALVLALTIAVEFVPARKQSGKEAVTYGDGDSGPLH